jgi:hypothetical protein
VGQGLSKRGTQGDLFAPSIEVGVSALSNSWRKGFAILFRYPRVLSTNMRIKVFEHHRTLI